MKYKHTITIADIQMNIVTEESPEVVEAMQTACKYYNIDCIRFKNIEKEEGHPTVKGMQDIKNEILEYVG